MSTFLRSSETSSYENESTLQRDAGITMIDKLNIQKGSTILDLGCGTGSLAKVLSGSVGPKGNVVAVDPDGERLKIAREKYSASNIEYIQAGTTMLYSAMPQFTGSKIRKVYINVYTTAFIQEVCLLSLLLMVVYRSQR